MNIARLRRERGWTQAILAKKAKLHPVSVAKIETGAITPTLPTLERIARALKVKPGALFEE